MKATTCCLIMGLLTFLSTLFCCSDKKPGIVAAPGYYFYENKWHYYGGFSNASFLEIADADTATFEKLDQIFPQASYARDKNKAYYNGKVISGAIGRSFSRMQGYLCKDESRVFYMTSVLSDDPAHFEIVDEYVTKDSKKVYWSDQPISDDPGNFRIIGRSGGHSYYADRKGVIANSTRLQGSDPTTFRVLSHGYSADESHVFSIRGTQVERIPQASPSTFKVLNPYYTLDAAHVFWNGQILKDADPASFRILNDEIHCSADKFRAYHRNNQIANTNPANFPKGKPCRYCTAEKIVFED